MPADSTDKQREAAIERLKAKRVFQAHIATFVIVNLFLVGLWAVSGAGFFWPIFIILGWGFGLLMHAWQVYGQKGITEDDVHREIERGGTDVV